MNSKHNFPVAENLLKQDFVAQKPNTVWVSDITYIWTLEECCYDNAVAERFFHILKIEHVYDYRYETLADARQSIFEYIEMFYNRTRRHSALGFKSSVSYELEAMAA